MPINSLIEVFPLRKDKVTFKKGILIQNGVMKVRLKVLLKEADEVGIEDNKGVA